MHQQQQQHPAMPGGILKDKEVGNAETMSSPWTLPYITLKQKHIKRIEL